MEGILKNIGIWKTQFKNNKSSYYISIICVIIIFYAFLFVQNYLKDPTRHYSDEVKNENIRVGDYELKLEEQKYNPKEKLYVLKYKVESTENRAVVINQDNLKVSVFMEKGYAQLKDVITYYPLNNYFIVEVKNIPTDYKALKVHFNLINNELDKKNEIKEVNQYTSALEKDKDETLKPKTKSEYYYDAFILRKKELMAKNETDEKEIDKMKMRIDEVEKENASLNPDDDTLSENEKQTVKDTIQQNKDEKEDLDKKIEEMNKEIKSTNANLDKIDEKLSTN